MLRTILICGLTVVVTTAIVKGDLTCKLDHNTLNHVWGQVDQWRQSEILPLSNGPQDFGSAPVYRKADGAPVPLH